MNLNKSASMRDTMFPVIEDPIYLRDGKDSGYKFIMREDTGEVLSCMTNSYKLVTNKEVIKKADNALVKTGAVLRECSVYGDGRKTIWRYAYPDTKIDIGEKDLVNPEVGIINSYDGTAGLQTWGGAFRLVCSNGLVIGIKLTSSNSKHSVYNEELNKIEENILHTVEVTTNMLRDTFPLLKETKINNKHIMEFIKMLPTYAMETLTQYLISNKHKTYWDLLNSLTYIATHHMGRQRMATLRVENEIYPKILNMAKLSNKAVA